MGQTFFAALKDQLALPCLPQPLHRLDMTASGCLALGLNPSILRQYYRQFQEHRVEKVYLALVRTDLNPDIFRASNAGDRKEMTSRWTTKNGRPSFTNAVDVEEKIARAAWRLVQTSVRSRQTRLRCKMTDAFGGQPVPRTGGPR